MHYIVLITYLTFAFFHVNNAYTQNTLDNNIAEIRYQVTAIEHRDCDKIAEFQKLIEQTDNLIKNNPNDSISYTWKGIALSAQAKHKGISALANAKQAKELLEKAIAMDANSVDPTAHNALGMLYYKVPGWPIGFGDDDKAQEFFKKAMAISSNIDTNYRFGEFLFHQGKKEEALQYLKKAYDLPNREGRREDSLKKEEILVLIESAKP